jgi:hypothetical protein
MAYKRYQADFAEVKGQINPEQTKLLWDMDYEEVVAPLMKKLEVVRSERLIDRANRRGLGLRDVDVNFVGEPWVTTAYGQYLPLTVRSQLEKIVRTAEVAHRKELREWLSLWLAFTFGLVGAIGTLFTVFYSRARIDSLSERVRKIESGGTANKSAERPKSPVAR